MARVVQTDLEEEEYRLFKELLGKQRLSIREGLRLAVDRMMKEEVKVNPKDGLLNRKPVGGSGVRDPQSSTIVTVFYNTPSGPLASLWNMLLAEAV